MTHSESSATFFQNSLVRLMPRLRRFARSLTRDPDLADDLVQSACERALDRMDHYEKDSRFDSWIYRIIYTRWIDKLRRRQRRRSYLRVLKKENDAASYGMGAESTLTSIIDVRSALEKLPEEQRAAILLVCVEAFSYAEAAEVLDLPVGTLASRVARARTALIGILYGAEPEQASALPSEVREKRK